MARARKPSAPPRNDTILYVIFGAVALIALVTILSMTSMGTVVVDEDGNVVGEAWGFSIPTLRGKMLANCGNGVVDGKEACDLGAGNGACPSACSKFCRTNTCGGVPPPPPTGGGGGGTSYASRCSPDEAEFCKLNPDMSRMVEKPDNGPCPTQMTCYGCQQGYEADTWIDECLAPGEEHFSACADLEGTACLRAADATSTANRDAAGNFLTQYVGKVTGEPGTYWAGKQWAVGYFCPGNSQGSDPWGGAISCYRCINGYHFVNGVCVSDGGAPTCDTRTNCLYQGTCHAVNTIMAEGAGWQTACGKVGTAPPQPYTCNAQKKGNAQKSDGLWFCCATGGIWTTDMTDCPGVR